MLALGHDPPMPAGAGFPAQPPVVPLELRELVRRLDPTPAAITDEMWTVLARNAAMTRWVGEYLDQVPPDQQNLILYLFSPQARQLLADVDGDRQAAVAGLRYQYARNVASPRFAVLVDRLLATGPEARDLWDATRPGHPAEALPVPDSAPGQGGRRRERGIHGTVGAAVAPGRHAPGRLRGSRLTHRKVRVMVPGCAHEVPVE